jgi:hypothetical protein
MACLAASIGMAGAVFVSAAVAQATQTAVLAWSPTTGSGVYDFGTLDSGAGATMSVTFTLSNSGGRSSAMIAANLTNVSGAAFSITADSCSATALGPNKSCQVTVEYAPTVNGESDSATLTATGVHASATSITLTGKSGTPDLTLTPGTLGTNPQYGTGKDVSGTKSYNYEFATGSSATQTFTVHNSGNGTSNTLQLAGLQQPFTLSNDQTSGQTLPPNGTSTFQLTFTAPALCPTELFATPLLVTSTTASPYIRVTYSAICGPPINSVSLTTPLANLTFPGNPELVSPGSGNLAGIAVNGTLRNVSCCPPPLLPATAHRLHGFTIQIPFSLTAGTLNCDMGRSYAPGTCSVTNNVLTVTQNFPAGFIPSWGPGRVQGMNYVYVGSDQLFPQFVTWGTPILTAVH